MAVELASATLTVEPLDAFARSVLWLAQAEKKGMRLGDLLMENSAGTQRILDLAIEYSELGQAQTGLRILQEFYLNPNAGKPVDPIVSYWAALLAQRLGQSPLSQKHLKQAQAQPGDWAFPIHWQSVQPLAAALAADPNDGKAALYLGHLQFALGRHEQGRELWRKVVKLEVSPAIALRALGMANLNLDNDPAAARAHLKQAHDLAPTDAIIARDLARVLFNLAEKADDRTQKLKLWEEIVGSLKTAFDEGRTRSDYVTLLARAQNCLGKHAETAKLLDTVRVTIWEGGREVHDLFE
jgi:tetratricopeptide (TPR) repeat protein